MLYGTVGFCPRLKYRERFSAPVGYALEEEEHCEHRHYFLPILWHPYSLICEEAAEVEVGARSNSSWRHSYWHFPERLSCYALPDLHCYDVPGCYLFWAVYYLWNDFDHENEKLWVWTWSWWEQPCCSCCVYAVAEEEAAI